MESTSSAATMAVVGHVSQSSASPSGAALAVGCCGGSPSQGPVAPPHSSAEPSYTTLSVTREKSAALHEDGDELETGSMVGEEMDMFDIELQREFQAGLGLARQGTTQTPPSHFYHFYTETGGGVGNGGRAAGLTLGGGTATMYGGAVSSWPWAQDAVVAVATSASHVAPSLPAAHSLPGTGPMSRGTGPILAASAALPMTRTMTGGSSSPASLTPPPTAPALVAGDGVAEAFAVKRFPSVAGACQVSSVLQDRDECMRVVHHLAEELRRELHLNTQGVGASGGAGTQAEQPSPMTGAASPSQAPSPSVAAGFDEDMKLLTMFMQDMQQSYHGAWRTPYSPGTAPLPSHAAASSYPTTTATTLTNNNNTNNSATSSGSNNMAAAGSAGGAPVMAASRANGVVSARTRTSSTSPTLQSTNGVSTAAAVIGAGAGAGGVSSGGVGHGAASHPTRGHGGAPLTSAASYNGGGPLPFHRTSPAGSRGAMPGLGGSANSTAIAAAPSWATATMMGLPTGRNTIDAEVNDSLRRIELAHTGAGGVSSLATLPLHEYEQRPINPYQGGPHGGLTTPRQVPQTQYPSHYVHYGHGGAAHTVAATQGSNSNNNNSATAVVPPMSVAAHGASRAEAGGALNMSAVMRKANRSSSGAHSVAHPRAVKPGVSKGRSRGPRSQTGKNVSPSNHSAFSECSGGETRSYQSTVTACHQNASSTNATTNTSLSSTVFRAHSGNQAMEVNGSASAGAGGAGPAGVAASAVVAGTVAASNEP